jgi:hypothetical protein
MCWEVLSSCIIGGFSRRAQLDEVKVKFSPLQALEALRFVRG